MANSGPHTNGSQFYIRWRRRRGRCKHSIFGRIASGMGAVRKLGMVPVDANDGPLLTRCAAPPVDTSICRARDDGGDRRGRAHGAAIGVVTGTIFEALGWARTRPGFFPARS